MPAWIFLLLAVGAALWPSTPREDKVLGYRLSILRKELKKIAPHVLGQTQATTSHIQNLALSLMQLPLVALARLKTERLDPDPAAAVTATSARSHGARKKIYRPSCRLDHGYWLLKLAVSQFLAKQFRQPRKKARYALPAAGGLPFICRLSLG